MVDSSDHSASENLDAGRNNQYDQYWNSFLPVFFDRISMVIKKVMTEAVKDYGITSSHAVYLIALDLQNGQTLMEISRFLDLDPANTNRVVKVLKEKGLIYDDRRSENSKKYRIYLTDLGREVAKIAMEATNRQLNDPFKSIPQEEILEVRTTLIKILNLIDPDLDQYMRSEWTHPFYTYLHLIPPKDKPGFIKVYPTTSDVEEDAVNDNDQDDLMQGRLC